MRNDEHEQSRALWSVYASERKLRSLAGASGLPAFEGNVKGAAIVVSAVGSVELGFRTRATTTANVAMRGSVEVSPAGEWAALVRHLIPWGFFRERALDRVLVVKSTSRVLARTVLDDRVVETVRALAPRRLSLAYIDGAIALEWSRVEREAGVLDDVVDVLGYLAVRGPELSPYR
jgi:hypothetical protein